MSVELIVPAVGESVSHVVVGQWLKSEGAWVERDEAIVVLETDKANMEVFAPVAGRVVQVLKKPGDTASIGEVLGLVDESAHKPAQKAEKTVEEPRVMPAAQRALAESGLRAEQVQATGPGGRVLKEDVQRAAATPATPPPSKAQAAPPALATGPRQEESVPMTPLRKTVAARLVEAQQTAALLTTFNEVDMSAVMDLRSRHQEAFTRKYGIKLGFMSFFVKASIEALKAFPAINAEIRGTDIVYRNYYDIGVAVGGGKGLVVPVLRNAEQLSFAQVEQSIADFAVRAREGKLKLEELQGGTFTISNGGVYGSLLSTPIVNPPQSGVLGMHKIQERPIALQGQVVVRPMMYLALTYDHRLVDGREAVSFLIRIKDCLEEPARLLIEV
ncbi:MAG: dihydrolipoyllysine-residue succinyltransferase component of 2-oxoglutarate dehydrogenase complex [Candidatus Xenobia bacterium]